MPVLLVLAVVCVLFLPLLACHRAPAPHDGPIVLITFDALRANVVGGMGGPPGLMPHLDALTREADWAGRAIAPSSADVPAMAALLTGLRPWQNQVLQPEQARMAPELITLSEALAARGYATAGYTSGYWYSERFGYSQGFEVFQG